MRYPFVWIELTLPIYVYFNIDEPLFLIRTLFFFSYLFIARKISGSQNNLDYISAKEKVLQSEKEVIKRNWNTNRWGYRTDRTKCENPLPNTLFAVCFRQRRFHLKHVQSSRSHYDWSFLNVKRKREEEKSGSRFHRFFIDARPFGKSTPSQPLHIFTCCPHEMCSQLIYIMLLIRWTELLSTCSSMLIDTLCFDWPLSFRWNWQTKTVRHQVVS